MNSILTTEKFNWLRKVGFIIKATEDSTGSVATLGSMKIVFYESHFDVNDRFALVNWRSLELLPFQYMIRGYMQQVLGEMIAKEGDLKIQQQLS